MVTLAAIPHPVRDLRNRFTFKAPVRELRHIDRRPMKCNARIRLSSILRGEMHDKALASRACTYERSSPAICGRLETRRGCLRRRWPMRLRSIAPISARLNGACTAQRSIWLTSWRRFWTLRRAYCFNGRQSRGPAKPNSFLPRVLKDQEWVLRTSKCVVRQPRRMPSPARPSRARDAVALCVRDRHPNGRRPVRGFASRCWRRVEPRPEGQRPRLAPPGSSSALREPVGRGVRSSASGRVKSSQAPKSSR